MHNELRYQTKIKAISDMPRKEPNTILCNFSPKKKKKKKKKKT